ncbi:MAG: hypothetical protein HKN22_05260, partial [Bacteroidia bacterium]|nr:hypothetical protein [Bacteroidia bacterium]
MKSLIRSILKAFGLGMYLDVYLLKKRSEQGELKLSYDRMTKFYGEFIKSGDLVFDVGANLGNYAWVF